MSEILPADQILLRCPECKAEQLVEREPIDYPEAVRIEVPCGRCDDGDTHAGMYFDAAGQHITRDPEAP